MKRRFLETGRLLSYVFCQLTTSLSIPRFLCYQEDSHHGGTSVREWRSEGEDEWKERKRGKRGVSWVGKVVPYSPTLLLHPSLPPKQLPTHHPTLTATTRRHITQKTRDIMLKGIEKRPSERRDSGKGVGKLVG